MGAIYRECVGCNVRYASVDEDLCENCYEDYNFYTEYEAMAAKEAKGKGRVPMPPPSKVMEDSRTQRIRSRGDSLRDAIEESRENDAICLNCDDEYCLGCDGK